MSTSVLVVDDQMLVRGGIVALLNSQPDLTVVGEAEDGAEAVELAARLSPDVIMMDIRMPVMDGVTATKRILADNDNGVAVLVLTTFALDEQVYAALRAGASGFLLKDTPPEELVRAVRTVAAGDALLSPSITRKLIGEFARQRPVPLPQGGRLTSLTYRENEVALLVARGFTNADIAEQLYVSEATVKTHLNRAMGKMELSSRAQVVAAVYEAGLLTPGNQ